MCYFSQQWSHLTKTNEKLRITSLNSKQKSYGVLVRLRYFVFNLPSTTRFWFVLNDLINLLHLYLIFGTPTKIINSILKQQHNRRSRFFYYAVVIYYYKALCLNYPCEGDALFFRKLGGRKCPSPIELGGIFSKIIK